MRDEADEQSFEGVGNGDCRFSPPDVAGLSGEEGLLSLARGLSPTSSLLPSMRRVASASNGVHRQQRSRRGSGGSDFTDRMSVSDTELHTEMCEISTQVSSIHKKLSELEEVRQTSEEKSARVKTENLVLRERINMLDEQIQQTEERWKEKLEEHKSRQKEMFTRMEREKQLELEAALLKFQMLEREVEQDRSEKERAEKENERLKTQLMLATNELEDVKFKAENSEAEKGTIAREYERYKMEIEQEMASSSDLVDELSRKNDILNRDVQARPRLSIFEKSDDLQEEVSRLKEENRQLRDKQDELQGELLQTSVSQGRSLLAQNFNEGPSLADELNGKDKQELINALKEQEMCNQKLRTYIEGILIRVIEKHPDLLEIADEEEENGLEN